MSTSDFMKARTKSRERKAPVSLALGSKFDKYKPEEEKDVRKVEVKEDEVLKQLKAAFKRFSYVRVKKPEENYPNASAQVKRISYSAKDVEKFSLALVDFQDRWTFEEAAGVFLSALINNGNDTDYVVHTEHLRRTIDSLGCRNTKNIIVNGSVGDDLGLFMKGGSITVNGNARSCVGLQMSGGTITVNGDAYTSVGQLMKGGEIHLNGKYEELDPYSICGRIYHKGVLIFPKRRSS